MNLVFDAIHINYYILQSKFLLFLKIIYFGRKIYNCKTLQILSYRIEYMYILNKPT